MRFRGVGGVADIKLKEQRDFLQQNPRFTN